MAVLIALSFVLVGGGLQASLGAGDASAYATAQACPSNVSSSTSCYRVVPMHLDAIDVTQSSATGGNLPIYTLRLDDGGTMYRAIVGSELLKPPSAGATVTTRVWRGRVVQVAAGGRLVRTYAYPVEPPGWLPVFLIGLGLVVLAGAALVAFAR